MKERGNLIAISGPSGVGKGTVCKKVIQRNPNVCVSVSATTRAPRPKEQHGKDYFFVSREEFEAMIASDDLLEYMDVFGTNYYGTPRKYVEEKLNEGMDVILEIDVNGAMNVKKRVPELVSVFITPPSMSVLKKRLEGRGTETPEQIERRFGKAKEEISHVPEYDYVVINDDLEKAVEDVECILRALKLRVNPDKLVQINKED